MEKLLKVKASYINALGCDVESVRKISEEELKTLVERSDVHVLLVNGKPAEDYIHTMKIA